MGKLYTYLKQVPVHALDRFFTVEERLIRKLAPRSDLFGPPIIIII
nr:hypothetical protein Q903MT_gene2544 [Picea sitchensis]